MSEIIKLEINKLQLSPGNILCVRFPENYPRREIERLSGIITRMMPAESGIVFLVGNIELSVIETEMKKVYIISNPMTTDGNVVSIHKTEEGRFDRLKKRNISTDRCHEFILE